MSLTYVQSKLSPFNGSGGTTAATFTASTPVAGNMLILGVRWNNTATISMIQDTNGNNWTQIGTTQTTGGIHFAAYFVQTNLVTHADTVTITWSVNTSSDGMVIAEYSGQLASSALDGGPVFTGAATTNISIGPVAATKVNETIITIGATNGGNAISSTGLSQNVRQSGSTNNAWLMDLAEAASGSYSDTLHQSTGQTNISFLMTFFSTTSGPVAVGWSPIDSRHAVFGFGPGPNTAVVDAQGNNIYSAQDPPFSGNSQVSDNASIPPVDSRKAGASVDSRKNIPVNSRVDPTGI